jgi:hypothetical protein
MEFVHTNDMLFIYKVYTNHDYTSSSGPFMKGLSAAEGGGAPAAELVSKGEN